MHFDSGASPPNHNGGCAVVPTAVTTFTQSMVSALPYGDPITRFDYVMDISSGDSEGTPFATTNPKETGSVHSIHDGCEEEQFQATDDSVLQKSGLSSSIVSWERLLHDIQTSIPREVVNKNGETNMVATGATEANAPACPSKQTTGSTLKRKMAYGIDDILGDRTIMNESVEQESRELHRLPTSPSLSTNSMNKCGEILGQLNHSDLLFKFYSAWWEVFNGKTIRNASFMSPKKKPFDSDDRIPPPPTTTTTTTAAITAFDIQNSQSVHKTVCPSTDVSSECALTTRSSDICTIASSTATTSAVNDHFTNRTDFDQIHPLTNMYWLGLLPSIEAAANASETSRVQGPSTSPLSHSILNKRREDDDRPLSTQFSTHSSAPNNGCDGYLGTAVGGLRPPANMEHLAIGHLASMTESASQMLASRTLGTMLAQSSMDGLLNSSALTTQHDGYHPFVPGYPLLPQAPPPHPSQMMSIGIAPPPPPNHPPSSSSNCSSASASSAAILSTYPLVTSRPIVTHPSCCNMMGIGMWPSASGESRLICVRLGVCMCVCVHSCFVSAI